MKKLMMSAIQALALAFAMLLPSFAQAGVTLVQDRDEPGRNAYSRSVICYTVSTYGTTSTCQAFFPPVPAGKRLVVTYVSAFVEMPAANTLVKTVLGRADGAHLAWLKSQAMSPYPGPVYGYAVSEPTYLTFEAGDIPMVMPMSNSTANFHVSATISGYLVTIP